MKFFGLGGKQDDAGFQVDTGEPKTRDTAPVASSASPPVPQVFDITPLNQRFERMEQSINQVAQLLAYAIQASQAQQEPPVDDPQFQPDPTQRQVTDQQSRSVVNPFYEQVMDYGEEAILRNPKIMGRIASEIEGRLNGVRSQADAQRELRQSIPEVYDDGSVVGKTRSAIRSQLSDVFNRMGISPGAVDTRLMEELVSYAAVGRHMNELVEQRNKRTAESVPNQQVPFVEGGSGGNLAPLTGSLSDAEKFVAERFGDTVDGYAATKKKMTDLGILERR